MTTHASVSAVRQPFGVLDSPRLQHLSSAKNRQNGLLSTPTAAGKPNMSSPLKSASLNSSNKRRLAPSDYDDCDSENIDPSVFASPTKRSKGDDGTPKKPSAFKLASTSSFSFTPAKASPLSSMPPPSTIPSRFQTPMARSKANSSSPRAPLTAPAGRSPKSKRAADLKNRRISAPFTRIDPPSFSRGGCSGLPFSLDAALAGTITRSAPKEAPKKAATIQDCMPQNWFFEIHEDTPEEEASNMMEHSTAVLDLSSDEESTKKADEEKGKENVPPPDFEAPIPRSTASHRAGATVGTHKSQIPRRKIQKLDAMDDGERSPLSDLETEDFFAVGLDKDSYIMVSALEEKETEKTTAELTQEIEQSVFAVEKACLHGTKEVTDVPVVTGEGDIHGDIIIFEDGDDVVDPTSVTASLEKWKRTVSDECGRDENAYPEAVAKN